MAGNFINLLLAGKTKKKKGKKLCSTQLRGVVSRVVCVIFAQRYANLLCIILILLDVLEEITEYLKVEKSIRQTKKKKF